MTYKMKSLKPSARENKRYMLVEGKNLRINIENAIKEFIGVFGLSKVGLSFIDKKNNSAIICINREMVDKVRASLCVFAEKIEVKKISGTLKSLKK